jgi:hypothetical protein
LGLALRSLIAVECPEFVTPTNCPEIVIVKYLHISALLSSRHCSPPKNARNAE